MGSDCEATDTSPGSILEQAKMQTETDLKTAISQLRKCEEVVEGKLDQLKRCTSNIYDVKKQLEVEADSDKREELQREKKEYDELEDHLKATLKAERELVKQSKVTITALNKKLYDIENEIVAKKQKEMAEITILRKKARDSKLKSVKTENPEERGAVGQTTERRSTSNSGSQHSMPPLVHLG